MSHEGSRVRKDHVTMLLAVALTLAACTATSDGSDDSGQGSPGASDSSSSTTVSGDSDSVDLPAVGELPSGPSALDTMFSDQFPEPLIDPGQVISGGPPPDGIPPIDDPVFIEVSENLELLPGSEPVVVVDINGDARAYPVRAMVWHEIVNDTVGGVPVAVTYCPLCNSAATYVRTINGVETTFGTSGRLFASALVMYDRATETLWTHYNGLAVIGVLTGIQLDEYPSPLMAWDQFRSIYPTGKVLDWTRTGFSRDYGRNPYVGYDDLENTPFLFRGALDDRAAAMQRIVGIEYLDNSAAIAIEVVSGGEGKATAVAVGDEQLIVFWVAGQASALDDNEIAGGRDVGSVAVFVPRIGDQDLTFSFVNGRFVDNETGSVWLLNGEAVEGELSGSRLVQVPQLDTFWFVWSTYQPDTTLVTG